MQNKNNILQIQNVSKYFGGLAAVSNCSLNIKKGSAVVFPGSLFHQVFNINKGIRWVVISFLFTDSESRINENKNNLFTFKQGNYDLNLKDITPLSNNN